MVGREETLLSSAFASPPVRIGFVDDLDDFASGEREIVRFLFHGLGDSHDVTLLFSLPCHPRCMPTEPSPSESLMAGVVRRDELEVG